ncbi:MAG: DUF4864 domain-containing protein [Nitrospira sp.]
MRRIMVILLMIAGLGSYWWERTYEPVRVIRAQLEAIDDGRYPQAYNYLSSMAKERLPFQEFVALIQANSVVMETRDTSFASRAIDGTTAAISGVLTGYSPFASDANYTLVQEDGQWRIQSFQWGNPRRCE